MPYVFPTTRCRHVVHPCPCDLAKPPPIPLVRDRDALAHPRLRFPDVRDHGAARPLAPDIRNVREL